MTGAGGNLGDFTRTREELLRRAREVIAGVQEGWLKLRIDRILPLAEAAEAHRLLEGRQSTGKLLLRPGA
jgi:NADPH:quinone reductase